MPIYAYRCTSCGFEKDVMQKISESRLTNCPACKTENFAKQLTAAGFQLKGTGWYATDFKGGGGAKVSAAKTETETGSEPKVETSADKTAGASANGVSPAPTGDATPAAGLTKPKASTPNAPSSVSAPGA